MINKYIDMHTHTNHSDGSSAVENSLNSTINMIHQSGGIAFLAHLYEYS